MDLQTDFEQYFRTSHHGLADGRALKEAKWIGPKGAVFRGLPDHEGSAIDAFTALEIQPSGYAVDELMRLAGFIRVRVMDHLISVVAMTVTRAQ